MHMKKDMNRHTTAAGRLKIGEEFNGSLAHTLLILMDGSYVLRNIKADPQIPKVRHTDFLRISVKLSRRPHPQNAHCQF